jgi:hypothetical protein
LLPRKGGAFMSFVRLTDDQLDVVFRLARPLSPGCREEFLRLLALEFRDRSDGIGDGELHRRMCAIIKDNHLFEAPSAYDTSSPGRRRSSA